MSETLEQANQAMRQAVRERLDATPKDDPKMIGYTHDEPEEDPTHIDDPGEDGLPHDWILRGAAELKRDRDQPTILPINNGLRPGSREFLAVLEELKDLHLRKTLDYGVDEDALSNIRQSADVINVPAWAGAILRISDKMHRLKAYFRRGKCEFDGLSDTLKDIACYAVIAEVLRRESDRP